MNDNEFLAELDRIKARVQPLERLVASCAASLPAPIFYHSGQESYGYRYGKPGLQHFCVLKAVRAVSALNAMILLARGGFSQEIGVLIRTMVECTTHIEFVLTALDENGALPSDVSKYVQDFLRTLPETARPTSNVRKFGKASLIEASARRLTTLPSRPALLGSAHPRSGCIPTSI